MSRHRGRLNARLSADGLDVLCGACGQRLAARRQGTSLLLQTPDDPSYVAFDVRGWEVGRDGWHVPLEERRDFFLGRKPRIKHYSARFPRLPVRAECPRCTARQWLRPGELNVTANEKNGTVRVRAFRQLSAIENPAWCAVHGVPSDGHGKHDVQAPC